MARMVPFALKAAHEDRDGKEGATRALLSPKGNSQGLLRNMSLCPTRKTNVPWPQVAKEFGKLIYVMSSNLLS